MKMIEVEVVYSGKHQQMIVSLMLPQGSTAAEAIVSSKVLSQFSELQAPEFINAELKDEESPRSAFNEIQHLQGRLGIFGHKVDLDAVLSDQDRVEIYQPLKQDPKEARRKRAKKAR